MKDSEKDIQFLDYNKAIIPTKGDDVEEKPENLDVEEKLEKLKALFDKGLITQEDYDRKKTELLEKF